MAFWVLPTLKKFEVFLQHLIFTSLGEAAIGSFDGRQSLQLPAPVNFNPQALQPCDLGSLVEIYICLCRLRRPLIEFRVFFILSRFSLNLLASLGAYATFTLIMSNDLFRVRLVPLFLSMALIVFRHVVIVLSELSVLF